MTETLTHRGWNLDVFRSVTTGLWQCDYWDRSNPDICGTISGQRRREVLELVKATVEGRVIVAKAAERQGEG